MLLLGFRASAGTSRRAVPPGSEAAPQSAAFSSCTVPECRANGSRRMHDFAAGIDKFDLRERLFPRNGLYAGAAQAHHAAEFAARNQIRRVHAQPCGQNPVERSGRSAAWQNPADRLLGKFLRAFRPDEAVESVVDADYA